MQHGANYWPPERILIFSDSTASLGNLTSGTSADEHSQHFVAQFLYLYVVYRIEFWIDWVPGKLNPADTYSSP